MRLIDADVARKTAVIDPVVHHIDRQPAIDAIPVVRCKDCKHLMYSDSYGECKRGYLGIVNPNDFCSRGERRSTNE